MSRVEESSASGPSPEARRWRAIAGACLVAGALLLSSLGVVRPGALPSEETVSAPPLASVAPAQASRPALVSAAAAVPAAGADERDAALVVGRVVDDRLRPVSGAVVTIRRSGRKPLVTSTDATGAFAGLVGTVPPGREWVGLSVETDRSLGAARVVRLEPSEGRRFDAGTIVLRPASDLRVRVRSGAAPVPSARVYASVDRGDGLRGSWFGHRGHDPDWAMESTTDAAGVAVFRAVPHGPVRLLAIADGPLRGAIEVAPPAERFEEVEVALRAARDVSVEVVDADEKTPVAGLRILTWFDDGLRGDDPFPTPVTDASGVAVVRAVPEGVTYAVSAVGDGFCHPFGQSPRGTIPKGATSFRLVLPAEQEVRWAIADGEGSRPLDGTTVELVDWSGWADEGGRGYRADAVVERGELVARSCKAGYGTAPLALLPDGRCALLARKGPIRFDRPRRLDVLVRDDAGSPVEGLPVRAKFRVGGWSTFTTRTDAAGRASFERLPAEKVDVAVERAPSLVDGFRWCVFLGDGAVDLTRGDGSLEVKVTALYEVGVRILVDGEPSIPRGLRLAFGVSSRTLDGWVLPSDTRIDAARGEVAIRARDPGLGSSLRAILRAPGFADAFVALPRPGEGPAFATVVLVRAATLRTRFTPASGDLGEECVQRLGEEGWRWATSSDSHADGDERVYEALVPGRYRLVDMSTGRVTEPVELKAGAPPPTLRLDVSRAGLVTGSVELPAGVTDDELKVRVEGEGLDAGVPCARRHDGTKLSVPVPGDRPVTISVSHPACVPDGESGSITLTTPRDGVVLRLRAR